MKIKSIETFSKKHIGLVRINDDSNNFGWGQVAPYNSDITVQILHRQIAKHALGSDTDDRSRIVPTKN